MSKKLSYKELEDMVHAARVKDIQRSATYGAEATVERITAEVHGRALERAEFALETLGSQYSEEWDMELRAAARVVLIDYFKDERA